MPIHQQARERGPIVGVALQSVRHEIAQRFGLRLEEAGAGSILGALDRLGSRLRLDPAGVLARALSDPNLLRELAGLLTIDETYFFRIAQQIEWAVAKTARDLAASEAGERLVWSAGCAAGEEPYSFVIALRELVGTVADRVRVFACDVKAEAIARARAGVYGEWSFRGVAEELRRRHFETIGKGRYALLPEHRDRVSFHHLGIEEMARTLESGSVRIVFFRNVGVYFDAAALARVHAAFRRVLSADGALIQAATDPVPAGGLYVRHECDPVGVFRVAPNAGAMRGEVPASSGVRAAALAAFSTSPATPRMAQPRSCDAASLKPPPLTTKRSALSLADRGQLEEALAIANRAVEDVPTDPAPVLFRAQLELARGNVGRSVEDLRRALFLDPGHRLGRYWYILALEAAGDSSRALGQLRALRRQIAELAPGDVLEDGEVGAGELREALDSLERSLT